MSALSDRGSHKKVAVQTAVCLSVLGENAFPDPFLGTKDYGPAKLEGKKHYIMGVLKLYNSESLA